MTLDTNFFERPTNISAKVICDSINEQGIRLTTFEIEYPRFILAELNVHRQLSKNSSSSRAIPIKKMLSQIEDNMAMPVYWGKAKSGMQADGEVDEDSVWWYREKWEFAYDEVSYRVKQLSDLVEGKKGFMEALHKQIPNRLIEPFQMMKTVITGTDWDNFFNLRIHPDAQPEICMLAYNMYQAMEDSKPKVLKSGEYHLPYVNTYRVKSGRGFGCVEYFTGVVGTESYYILTLEQAIKLSAASCASVSYRTEGMTLEKADKIFDMLIKAEVIHSSPFEHLATPIKKYLCVFKDNDYGFADSEVDLDLSVNLTYNNRTWEEGVTHMNKQGELCSGNLRGFIQYRHLLPNNTAWQFDFQERMKLFK